MKPENRATLILHLNDISGRLQTPAVFKLPYETRDQAEHRAVLDVATSELSTQTVVIAT
jgi:hypothetical protein